MCGRSFKTGPALGGHISKGHPDQRLDREVIEISKQQDIALFKIQKVEREGNDQDMQNDSSNKVVKNFKPEYAD